MKLQEEGLFPTCKEVITAQDFPAGTTEIPDHAFSGCSSLTSISLPDGVTSIGDGAFLVLVYIVHLYVSSTMCSIISTPNSGNEVDSSTFSW